MTAHRTGDYSTKLALHEKYYSKTSSALLAHIDDFLEEIDKLIHKAETVGVHDPDSPYIKYEHPRLPLIHRHNLFVRETFQAVRDLVQSHVLLDVLRKTNRVRLRACAERFRRKRPRNRPRNDPRPREMATSPSKEVKTRRDAARAPELPMILCESSTVTLSSSFLKQIMERAAFLSAATRV